METLFPRTELDFQLYQEFLQILNEKKCLVVGICVRKEELNALIYEKVDVSTFMSLIFCFLEKKICIEFLIIGHY
jgi:hypothetical protein